MTILQALEHATQTLMQRREIPRAEARARARLLIDDLYGLSYAHLFGGPERTLEGAQQDDFDRALEEAVRGRPLPYIVNRREFHGLDFHVDERALIPRPETEFLVEAALQRLCGTLTPQIADLGTGSGCIAIALAHARPDATIWATDISHDALALARRNVEYHALDERIHLVHSAGEDWAAPLQNMTCGTLDAIVSNPPYIASLEIENLQSEVRDWEPRGALDGGVDGLDAYRQLAAQIRPLLKPSGFVALELGSGQFESVRALFQAQGWEVEALIFDFAAIERVLVAR